MQCLQQEYPRIGTVCIIRKALLAEVRIEQGIVERKTDPMVGGGTSVEVAREMGIEAHELDPHSGLNILKQCILEAVGKPSDLLLSQPHHNTLVYSGEVTAGSAREITAPIDSRVTIGGSCRISERRPKGST